jgi:hypothetical protein
MNTHFNKISPGCLRCNNKHHAFIQSSGPKTPVNRLHFYVNARNNRPPLEGNIDYRAILGFAQSPYRPLMRSFEVWSDGRLWCADILLFFCFSSSLECFVVVERCRRRRHLWDILSLCNCREEMSLLRCWALEDFASLFACVFLAFFFLRDVIPTFDT